MKLRYCYFNIEREVVMKYSEIMLTNKVEYPFEVMMLKTLIDLARWTINNRHGGGRHK